MTNSVNKKLMVNDDKLVLLSYTPAFAYKLNVFIINDSDTLTEITSASETGTGSVAPTLRVSDDLSKIAIKTQSSASAYAYKLVNVNYAKRTAFKPTLPTAMASVNNEVRVSDKFLYVRNLVSVGGSMKEYGYEFRGKTLVSLLNNVVTGTDYKRTIVLTNDDS